MYGIIEFTAEHSLSLPEGYRFKLSCLLNEDGKPDKDFPSLYLEKNSNKYEMLSIADNGPWLKNTVYKSLKKFDNGKLEKEDLDLLLSNNNKKEGDIVNIKGTTENYIELYNMMNSAIKAGLL